MTIEERTERFFGRPYAVDLMRVADGTVRRCQMPGWSEGSDFMWSDGNFACDCQRAMTFARSAGEEPPVDPPCTSSAYRLLRYIFDDGTIEEVDERV